MLFSSNMIIDIITIFPDFFDCFLKESLISKAIQKKLIEIKIHNLRNWAKNKHKTVDDKPFGGGLGMVLKPEPIFQAVLDIKKDRSLSKSTVITFTPRGKNFNQKMASDFSKKEHLIMICGRYEGIDDRVCKYLSDINVSLGKYVLMGGELPAMVISEAVLRYIPGIVGKPEFLAERTSSGKFIEYPQYTRPEVLNFNNKKLKVPKDLISGNHKKINEWKKSHGKFF